MLVNEENGLILRPCNDADLAALYRIRNNYGIQSLLLTYPRPNNYKRTKEWIENKSQSQDSAFFVISNSENQTIGFIQATQMDLVSKTCYIGIAIDEEFRGKGIAACAINLIETYLIKIFNIRKTIVNILSENMSSIVSFSRAGYKKVGVHKLHFYFDNRYHDVTIMEKILTK